MSLYGTLTTMSLADLFQWLKTSHKSGILTVLCGEEERVLYFKRGLIEFYSSRELRENLGQLLVSFGLVQEKDITTAYRIARQTSAPMARVLLDKGFVNQEMVESFLSASARDTVLDLFLEEEGSFVFSDATDLFEVDEGPFDRIALDLDMEEATLDGMRRIDEWGEVKAKLSSDAIQLRLISDGWKEAVKAQTREWRIFTAVERGLTIGEICFELRSSRYSVYRILYRALLDNLVSIDDQPLDERPAPHGEQDRVKTLLLQAKVMLEAHQWGEAAALYELIARINPQDAEARAGQRRAHEEQAAELYQTMPPIGIPELSVPREKLRDFQLSSEELFLASRIDGSWDVGALIMVSPLPELATLKTLHKLQHIGVMALK